jgi:hypothetical protein
VLWIRIRQKKLLVSDYWDSLHKNFVTVGVTPNILEAKENEVGGVSIECLTSALRFYRKI